MMVPQGAYVYLGENIKNEVNVPVFMANRINDPVLAEKILRANFTLSIMVKPSQSA